MQTAPAAVFREGEKIVKIKPLTVIGLNSGTSMDGIDAAAFRISPLTPYSEQEKRPKLTFEMIGSLLYEFEPALKSRMQALIAAGHASFEEICRLDAALGEEFARAAIKLSRSLQGNKVDLIGSHGQTVWHAPELRTYGGVYCRASMQLGEPDIIAARTKTPVIADFRVKDLACGGQGAPLVAFADEVLFAEKGKAVAVLNLGGIANITVLDDSGNAVLAFDTGPANMLIDRACRRLFDREFDENGNLAFAGEINEDWLKDLLQLPYYRQSPPKTTGRELFGRNYADTLIDQAIKKEMKAESIIATLSALTAASIAMQYQLFIKEKVEVKKLVLGGGGASNKFLASELKNRWSDDELEILNHEDYGISSKFKEALLFALLAYTRYFQIPNNVPLCTGAAGRVSLGKLCLP